ncbi:MAG: DedA family protein [Treponema sp.]
MDLILAWLNCHVHSFPLVIFIALLLGGFNLPISEDVLVITSAILCQTEKARIAPFYLAIFFGAVISDCIVYFWGWLLGRGFISIKLFTRIIKEDNTIRFSRALDKYGIFAYLIFRFIPFGVRNVMSMASGFLNFYFIKFLIFDSIAALCNTSVLFWFVYFFGRTGGTYFKIFGIILFILLICLCIYLFRSNKFSEFIDKQLEEKNV